ncbi:hypothetical protein BDF21DRAFT_433465 [Thamnidium elegans]|nr:hypothetical protein BDF21DRAFT_433465 [Thamnidium elegans]
MSSIREQFETGFVPILLPLLQFTIYKYMVFAKWLINTATILYSRLSVIAEGTLSLAWLSLGLPACNR